MAASEQGSGERVISTVPKVTVAYRRAMRSAGYPWNCQPHMAARVEGREVPLSWSRPSSALRRRTADSPSPRSAHGWAGGHAQKGGPDPGL